MGFAIECPAGVILQTGDFKVDYTPISGGPTDLVTIGEYGKKGVLALLSDSTNSERPGFTSTELKVGQSFATLFQRAQKKRIIIATFASNVYRIQQIIDLAVAAGRKVAVSGRSMVNNTQMALELGYLHAPEGVLIDIEEINPVSYTHLDVYKRQVPLCSALPSHWNRLLSLSKIPFRMDVPDLILSMSICFINLCEEICK